MRVDQPTLFEAKPPDPEGFRYEMDLLSPAEEQKFVRHFANIEFEPFAFRGYTGNRRVVSFGWEYDFTQGRLGPADDLPDFLLPLRDAAAAFAGLQPSNLPHALLTEYGPGAGIGWHKDKGVFGTVVGISLLSPCIFRFRRKAGTRWERISSPLEPRSAYLLEGASRTEWEHSIPAVSALRYSVTFRTVQGT